MGRIHPRIVATAGLALLVSACGAVVEPAGPGARSISDLWWLMFWLGLIPIAIVVAFIVAIALRRHKEESRPNDQRIVVYGGVVLSSLLLIPVIVMTAVTQLDLGMSGDDRLTVELTGHQFWWDIVYIDGDERVRTANELHLPTDMPIDLHLTSIDVIHSVWIPEIHGKMDLIPGQTNTLEIQVDDPGIYQGRCAEFCGLSHALMQLTVIAHPPDEFESWLEAEAAPADIDVETGQLQTYANSCGPCHTIRGVFDDPIYEGDFGPDLTHLASRRQIGANILPNTREALGRWIIDPQGVKPGNRMPDVNLDAGALTDILDLLSQLDGHGEAEGND